MAAKMQPKTFRVRHVHLCIIFSLNATSIEGASVSLCLSSRPPLTARPSATNDSSSVLAGRPDGWVGMHVLYPIAVRRFPCGWVDQEKKIWLFGQNQPRRTSHQDRVTTFASSEY
ncbi:hypothetical protein QBC47DRAFT_389139 [Echria macrotheca]|uniref:Secreted protein n=1 Tax=Echria macrotheca TaxID=438768 RepID=A0AAJ0B6P2_9PEZI|nr:hypothetical protein QBC47DRAFT_389139 [Echria macrotheca]